MKRIRKSRPLSICGIRLLLSGVAFAQSNIYTFPGPDVDLGLFSINVELSGQHYIGGRGDTVYVLQQSGSVYCHKSTDGGKIFDLTVPVDFGTNALMKVDTAGVVYVAYQSYDGDIYFSKSIDEGISFSPGVKVNDDTIPETGQACPAVAVNNRGQIFIAWEDQRNSAPHTRQMVFTSTSYDGGLSFSPNVQINDSFSPLGVGLDIAADDEGHVYVAWTSYYDTLYVIRSDDSGRSFSFRVPVNTAVYDLSLAVTDSIIGVAWDFIGNSRLRFSVSYDYGQTFTPSVIVDSSGYPQYPSLYWKNGAFYVVWRALHRRTPGGPVLDHMWFSYSRDSGKTFVPFVDAVPDDTNSVTHFNPTIWVNEMEKAFVAWTDARWDPWFEETHHLFVSVGKPSGVKGDLDFDGIITGKDIVMEINAVFLGLPFPAPSHRADLNCDGKQTAVDLVLLLNWWYLGTPLPCD